MKQLLLALALTLISSLSYAETPPISFDKAKVLAKESIYHDKHQTFYCGCDFQFTGKSGGRIELESCGYKPRSEGNLNRAERLEWEHVVPASNFGKARQCWQNGGRENCQSTDPVFSAMEADLHNLVPEIGELNGDRSNYNFGIVQKGSDYGACNFKVDFKDRTAEPADNVKGEVARIYFYMHDRYDMRMSPQQQKLLIAWAEKYPTSAWEIERDKRIAKIMGHSNPFVTGESKWTLNHKNSKAGVVTELPKDFFAKDKTSEPSPEPATKDAASVVKAPAEEPIPVNLASAEAIIGNSNSKIYHLPSGCPSYDKVSPKNRVEFASASEAESAGYRIAKNCK